MIKEFKVSDYTIIINENVLKIFNHYRQTSSKMNEAGGILLGQLKNKTIYIQKASIPNMFDKQSRLNFVRDKNAAQIIIDYEFINSSSDIVYLGEWHTHPEGDPIPSGTDKKMIKDQFNLGKLNESFVILIIQGIKGLYVAIYDNNELTHAAELLG
jgi:integrative and conjugative element protein (TIGR02256 family)